MDQEIRYSLGFSMQKVLMKLARKILLYKSESGNTHRLRFGEKAITFESLSGKDEGLSRTMFYDTLEIAPKEHYISWLDTNNETVRMIVNLNNKTIKYNYLSNGVRQFSKGKIIYFGLPAHSSRYKIQRTLNWILFWKETNGI